MGLSTSRRICTLGSVPFLVCMGLLLATPGPAFADDRGEDFWPDGNKPKAKTQIDHRVDARSDGVYIQISVRQVMPGTGSSSSRTGSTTQLVSTRSHTVGSSNSGSSSTTTNSAGGNAASTHRPGRSWTDVTGYHYETPAGQVVTLTPPMISSATRESWMTQLQQHQNETPYLMYVDQQFGGLIWVPSSTAASNVQVALAPAGPPPQAAMPTGNGASTDPREVALDALGHQPLPDAQVRMNPAVGLVAMPTWFWVEGYDGSAFGTSRTVEIPPEVGPEVPTTVVPANDPRRQGSSFTVEVRIWPTRYEWSFGDGTGMVSGSLGQRYPAPSEIQHTYEFSSLRFQSGFPVWLTIEFAAEYRVNGGSPSGLPSIRRTYESGYRVQEVQPVLTSR